MRILQIISHYVPAYRFGGPLRVAHSLGKALTRHGHEITVCTTNLADDRADLDVPLDVPVDVDGITVYYEPTYLLRYWGFSPRLWWRLRKLVSEADIVLVHFHYQFASWAGASLANLKSKPYVVFSHGSLNQWGIENKGLRKKSLYLRFVERRNIEQSLFVAFNSWEEKAYSVFSDHGLVVPSGIDPMDFRDAPPAGSWRNRHPHTLGKTCFLYLGRLNPAQKGLDLLISAFAKLAHQRADVHLILAGPDERGGQAVVVSMIQKLGMAERVTLTGMVAGEEKLSLLKDSDVFVLASPSEGTSIALLEAMYIGLPVVVTNRVGLSARIQQEECGVVIDRNEDLLEDAMRQMLVPEVRKSMGQKGQMLVKSEFTWDAIALDFLTQVSERLT